MCCINIMQQTHSNMHTLRTFFISCVDFFIKFRSLISNKYKLVGYCLLASIWCANRCTLYITFSETKTWVNLIFYNNLSSTGNAWERLNHCSFYTHPRANPLALNHWARSLKCRDANSAILICNTFADSYISYILMLNYWIISCNLWWSYQLWTVYNSMMWKNKKLTRYFLSFGVLSQPPLQWLTKTSLIVARSFSLLAMAFISNHDDRTLTHAILRNLACNWE